jgi:hypothetical protein
MLRYRLRTMLIVVAMVGAPTAWVADRQHASESEFTAGKPLGSPIASREGLVRNHPQ